MGRFFGYQASWRDAQLAGYEFLVFFFSFSLPVLVAGLLSNASNPSSVDVFDVVLSGALFSVSLSATMFVFGLDSRSLDSSDGAFSLRLAIAILAGGTLLSLSFRFFQLSFSTFELLLVSSALAFCGILATRRTISRLVELGWRGRRVIIIGTGESALEIQNLISCARPLRYKIAGYYETASSSQASAFIPKSQLLDNSQSLIDLAIENHVDEIVVAVTDRRGALPVDGLLKAKLKGIEVTDLLTFYERECSTIKFEYMHPSCIVFSPYFRLGAQKRFVKRAFDLTIALILLVVTAPLMLIVTVASVIESRGRGPVLYFQERVGFGGRIFRIYKFRSMTVNAERDGQARWASAEDDRVTRLGKVLRRYRLDELPQVFNILAGDMSLVGPRPERPEFVENLAAAIPYYGERHYIKPGLAGWAQIMYPYGASIEDAKRKLEYDLYYIKHATVLLDLLILLRTVETVLLGKGVR